MIIDDLYPYFFIVVAVILSIASGKIDLPGGISGGLITLLLFASISYLGIVLIGVFFVAGTAASLYKLKTKRQWGISEGKSGKRSWKNVLSNSGVAGMIALIDVWLPNLILCDSVLIATCFAAALSDTLSSEMGNVSGKRYFNILSWKPDLRGKDGVVSVEGTAWGVGGSLVIALVYAAFQSLSPWVWIIAAAGIAGNVIDSILGATVQKGGILDNHGVNFVSTTLATGIAAVFTFW
ncbi:MAG: DUF92 domain-containing protein [Cyclobacteriaceae bacterium]